MWLPANRIIEIISFSVKALGPLPSSGYSLMVIDKHGANFRTASAAEATALAEKKQIVAKGSDSKLKYAELTVDPAEARMTIDEVNSPTPCVRAKTFRDSVPSAEDNQTVRRVNDSKGQYFQHRNHICATYPQFATAGRAD